MANMTYDLVVIGAGPGGYVAAIRATQLGIKTAIIEREHLGGICLNWGCIPTKALLRSADIYRNILHADEFGLNVGNAGYDVQAMVARSRKVAARLNAGVRHLLTKNKVTIIEGQAKLEMPDSQNKKLHLLSIKMPDKEETVLAKNVIIATGARARDLPFAQADGDKIWSYKHALQAKKAPKSMVVIGSGAIGIEFSSFFNCFGTEVTVIEMMDRILPVEDQEISKMAHLSFKKQGMNILTNTRLNKVEKTKTGVVVDIEKDNKTQKIEAEILLSAVGIVGNVENIGLEELGIEFKNSHINVDEYCRTNIDGIFAIGDVAGAPWLAHKAEFEGVMVVESLAGMDVKPICQQKIPACTYSHPQIASIGLSEEKAKSAGYDLKIGRFPFVGNGKAIALGEDQGLIKTIFDA
ncbi:MAG: dihydrolipoyl dehydrogenase, partial [Pseudomonadota bacterium]